MKDTIQTAAYELEDTATNLSTVSKLTGIAVSEAGTEKPDYERIETLLYAVMDLIDLHAGNIQYWSDELKELI